MLMTLLQTTLDLLYVKFYCVCMSGWIMYTKDYSSSVVNASYLTTPLDIPKKERVHIRG